jgi:hypothetical protein
MSELTNSEAMFDQYARVRGYACERLRADGVSKSADFKIIIKGTPIICEISELRPNPTDMAVAAALNRHRIAGLYDMIGRRLQNKIKEEKDQLRKYRGTGIATIIVFVREAGLAGDYLSEDDFQAAMYGLPRSPSPTSDIILGHGKKRLFGKGNCEYISALCRLDSSNLMAYEMSIFHNYYAAVPLSRALFADTSDKHFSKLVDPAHGPWGWSK